MKTKKILSLLLSVAMLFSMASFVYADEPAYEPEIIKANIAEFYDAEAVVYDSYDVDEDNGVVATTAENLKKHGNANGTEGYWTGFAVKAPATSR